MTIILVLVGLAALGVALAKLSSPYGAWEPVGAVLAVVACVGLLFSAITIPVTRMEAASFAAELDAMRVTAEESRATGESLEGAAWRMKAAEINGEIASIKLWNTTAFDIWWPDAVVAGLEPLR